jgi:hypothetical protein
MFNHFYNQQFRRFILAFGSFFDSLYVVRTDINGQEIQRIQVPIEYGPKEKWLTHITQDPDFQQSVAITVPRLAFELTGIGYDASRKLKTLNQFKYPSTEPGKMARTWAGVPYTLTFDLTALVKFQSDGFQIVEQVLPYFTPDLSFAIQTLPGIGVIDSVPLTLTSVNQNDNYEGDFERRRIILWTLSFAMKVFFYGPTRTADRIERVDVDVYTSPYLDLAEAPVNILDETGHPLLTEDGVALDDESTDDGYLTIAPKVEMTTIADPLNQTNVPPNVTGTTTIEELA